MGAAPATLSVLGSMPTVPETKPNCPALTAWLKRGDLGVSAVAMTWRVMVILLD
jgi:hypothetical protein